MQCLPRISTHFSYHFPNYGSNKGGIVEAFSAYFEPHNMPVDEVKQTLKDRLYKRNLSSLADVLSSQSSSEELVMLIDFLLQKDVEKFKRFYVLVTKSKKADI